MHLYLLLLVYLFVYLFLAIFMILCIWTNAAISRVIVADFNNEGLTSG